MGAQHRTMMRKGIMKRLSKSASDISGCRKKTHSTSPDEESREFATPPPHSEDEAADDEEDDEDQHIRSFSQRPLSIQNAMSVPSSLHKRHDDLQASREEANSALYPQSKETDRRRSTTTGFLGLLRRRLANSRSSSRESDRSSRGSTPHHRKSHIGASTSTTPEGKKALQRQVSTRSCHQPASSPEIVRYKVSNNQATGANNFEAPEVIRHHHVTPIASLPMALAQELELARLKEERDKTAETPKEATTAPSPSSIAMPKDPASSHNRMPDSHGQEASKSVPTPHESVEPRGKDRMVHQPSSDESFHSVNDDQHIAQLRSHAFFHLHVHLKQGYDLAARDSNGTSDPYVKFLIKGKVVHKTKTIYKDLNPFWDEQFVLNIEDPFVPVHIKVYDYDWAFRDDFMGEATLSLVRLELEKTFPLVIQLAEHGKSEYLGQLAITVKLEPKSPADRSMSIMSSLSLAGSIRSTSEPATIKRMRGQSLSAWSAVVNVVLIEAKDLLAMDFEGTSDPYCKFRLGNDRYKSKIIYETLNPKWLEQFDLNLYEDQPKELEITVWDKDQRSKDDFIGRCAVDLSHFAKDCTHDNWYDLEDGSGKIHLLISISGLTQAHPIIDLANYEDPKFEERISSYSYQNILWNWNDIGTLSIKIYCAKGLYAADLNGKSDPFVVLELDNERIQTHTEYKTITPTWNRIFVLPVKDIHSVLYITVNDEDRNHTFEFLGKLAIPLLRIETRKKKWFALKDKKMRCRAKGNNPQILLEMDLKWNPVRAAIRTLNPKDERYLTVCEKFKRQIFLNNVMRVKAIIMEFVDLGKFLESCLEWENPIQSLLVFISIVVITYYFQPYMFPIFLLLIFLKNYVILSYLDSQSNAGAKGTPHHHHQMEEHLDSYEDEELDDKDEEKEEKKTLKAKLQAIQEVTAMVQNAIGYVASLGEEVKNTFNFSVPYLSWLAIVILIIIALILYFISLRFLVIVWAINKFSKKFIRPDYVPNNELLDFLSRVPDDEELNDAKELKLYLEEITTPNKKLPKKKQK
ncbi:hypothetical protein TCAL_04074 [Tigriopus californicus]|uniref:C2 domain-containing protein n=1 Tax=Tigriopus californicus TaxID=6832 RepID=A0A553PG47_TIGCA|nr:multiple C2 and transmembrane domain-containing protein-like [Tigriopus californicus]XP_059083310.1 multiple C2 and transmembrane domain-containing protein-like [Tigriopus californicus]XP_059083311.1 multiple C2 and transmembrane domain-containing protein-like [Tigriopus californicus]TRY76651.1 hypothetical protein TCAL_04074 [Tigriopus californicus]